MNAIPISQKLWRFVLAAVGFPLSLGQYFLSMKDMAAGKQPGKTVQAGNHQLHAVVTGSGVPTIIVESGMGGCSLDWSLVQPELSKDATVLETNRR